MNSISGYDDGSAVSSGGSGRNRARARKLRALGLDAERARLSAGNGHGPWWNAGASHMNQALPARHFARMGLVSLLPELQRLQSVC